jgi:hypothetical protein
MVCKIRKSKNKMKVKEVKTGRYPIYRDLIHNEDATNQKKNHELQFAVLPRCPTNFSRYNTC